MTTTNNITLPVVQLAGLHLDTLGHYFAALGLLRLATRQWPTAKGCWRNGIFCLVGGPQSISELETFLLNIGAKGEWTPYTQAWAEVQKESTAVNQKAAQKQGREKENLQCAASEILARWLANVDETEAQMFSSHIVAASKRAFNDLFGTGGNAGKRNFSKGWAKARDAVKAVAPSTVRRRQRNSAEQANLFPPEMPAAAKQDLIAFLNNRVCSLLADYGAACWFSDANKKYNFSPDRPYAEGQITPWAMLLACEAFPLLVGGVSRQIGSAREGTGAFPFVTKGPAPESAGDTETVTGEFWAPVWNRPFSVAEVSALYKRGRAEINGRGAITSAAFAAAIIQSGTDAGLDEFRRFTLLHTTSNNTFESRLASIHPLAVMNSDIAQANAISLIIRFRDALPRDGKRFSGLQGPIDNALVRLSASGNNIYLLRENAWALLDTVFAALERTANNKTYREHEPALELLPVSWAVALLEKEHSLIPETRIALALATLRSDAKKDAAFDKTTAPLLAYRIGVVPAWKNNWRKVKISKNAPLRVEWCNRPLTDNIAAAIRRRAAIEAESHTPPPFDCRLTLSLSDADAFLHGETDDTLIANWLDRFLLFDWSFLSEDIRKSLSNLMYNHTVGNCATSNATSLLYSFFRPLFHYHTFLQMQNKQRSAQTTTAGMLRPIIAHLERGDTAAAFSAARSRYKSMLIKLADFGENVFAISDSSRMLAALLLPVLPFNIIKLFSRFQITQPTNKE